MYENVSCRISRKINSEFGYFAVALCKHLDLITKYRGFESCNLKSYRTALKIIALSEGKDLKNFDGKEIADFAIYWGHHYTTEVESVLKRDSDDYKMSNDYLEKWIAAQLGYQWNSLPVIFKNMLKQKLYENLDHLSNEIKDKLKKDKKQDEKSKSA